MYAGSVQDYSQIYMTWVKYIYVSYSNISMCTCHDWKQTSTFSTFGHFNFNMNINKHNLKNRLIIYLDHEKKNDEIYK